MATFRVGEYVETPSAAGIVREIGLFVTRLDTYDGLYLTPLSGTSRSSTTAATPPGCSTSGSVSTPIPARRSKPSTQFSPKISALRGLPPGAFVDSMSDNFVFLGVRTWVGNSVFWPTHRDLVTALKARLEAADIPVQRLLHPTPDIGPSHPARRGTRLIATPNAPRTGA